MVPLADALTMLRLGEITVEQYAKARHLDPLPPAWHLCSAHRRWSTKPCSPILEDYELLWSCASGAPAELPTSFAIVEGFDRPVPSPPGWLARRRARRPTG